MNPIAFLPSYLHRISHPPNPSPTLDTLRSLHRAHALSIPFENFDPLLGRSVELDSASLERKLVHDRRGGYCFEHNLLFKQALQAIGFNVTGLAARVLWNVQEGVVTPRTHMLLRVDLEEGVYLADVGFGGLTQTEPLRLEPDLEQPTSLEPFRLLRTGDEFTLQALRRGTWKPLYRFDLQPQHLIDYELSNYHVATHPRSLFVHHLLAARPDTDRRYALFNNDFSIHHLHGPTERRTLTDPAELRAVLEGPFALSLPDDPGLDALLIRLAQLPAPEPA